MLQGCENLIRDTSKKIANLDGEQKSLRFWFEQSVFTWSMLNLLFWVIQQLSWGCVNPRSTCQLTLHQQQHNRRNSESDKAANQKSLLMPINASVTPTIVSSGQNSSVGRAPDWRSGGPWYSTTLPSGPLGQASIPGFDNSLIPAGLFFLFFFYIYFIVD